MNVKLVILLLILANALGANASEFLSVESDKSTYNLVSHYSIEINAKSSNVWKHLVNLGSWMYDFEMSHHAGKEGQVGEILRLYPSQDFFVQVTGVIANELLSISNLPATFNGEYSTGVGVITLNEINNKTIVNLTMSRRYSWNGEGENPMKTKRNTKEFQKSTADTWKKFLHKLKTLAEST